MSMLYDIYYPDGTCDREVELPDDAPDGSVASCVNWDDHSISRVGEEWIEEED